MAIVEPNRMKALSTIALISLLMVSCKPDAEQGESLFKLLSGGVTHVAFKNELTENEGLNMIEYLYFNNGGGVAAGDINNDGLADLYFTSNQKPNRLYLNMGNMRFEDITNTAGVAGEGDWTTGVTMADVNGDGFLDIYVCCVGKYKGLKGRNQLFVNNGDNTFREEAGQYGLDFQGFSTQSAFFDYDLDGDLDMYLLNHSVHTSRSYGSSDLRFETDARAGDRLYRNDPDGEGRIFRDATDASGIYRSQIGYGLGVNICDINDDGFPDIFVSNDFHENDYLYINNGDGTFSEQLTRMLAHTSRSSMGNDVADFNNDGMLDIVVLDMLPDNQKLLKQSGGEDDMELYDLKLDYGYYFQFVRNTLQLNLGGGLFSEIGRLSGVFATDWSWSPLFCDVDNDGWKDLFITNGIYRRANDLDYIDFLTGGNRFPPEYDNSGLSDRDLYEKMPLHPRVNYLFRNNGDLTFTDRSRKWGFDIPTYSNGSTYADLDNDGDLDLVTNNINEPAGIFMNRADSESGNHFLSVSLIGEGLNTRGVGARLTVYCNELELTEEQFATRGFMSATAGVLHFGLGHALVIDSLVIRWPDLREERLKNVKADRLLILEQKNASGHWQRRQERQAGGNRFNPVVVPGLEYRHREDPYKDLMREKLIPHDLSAEGPAVATGDVNGDGLEDLFAGGAAGQAAQLFILNRAGSFRSPSLPVLLDERLTEDVDAAFFDAEGDGDLDLYIVRGGNHATAGDTLLADLFLLNDGRGGYSRSKPGSVPFMARNGSCVKPADYDGDGDMDLFVGSRSVPGAYGIPSDQTLLENNGSGAFSDVTHSRAPGLEGLGMVTDACWIDFDGDSDPDLFLVGEWMNITLFENNGGHFTNKSLKAGLGETSGWWNCVEAGDLDQDGDPDLVCGNLGLNSLLKASPGQPVEMYVNDFDNNGTMEPLICSYYHGKSYPVASLDQLAAQIHGMRQQFPHYSDYGGKTTGEIFSREVLDRSTYRQANLFVSCILTNLGDGTFKLDTLPVEAQFSPVRDVLIDDVNGDGWPDLVLAGNNYRVRPSFGRYDASFGWYLPGVPGKGYNVRTPVQSGLRIEGDARRIVSLRSGADRFLVAGINDDSLRIFSY